ncbi:ATP-binding protein [Pedobacter endophyticus]|uniref:ATP-binding protein n=1 Tax=Pedobacter endophyticus TaxID=2789740 RepID=A0A7U3SP73_9SPHI|nr:ATP-binding protein [Pedobacter endophyticus]QPH38153.1 ATP-binding protein [Pedobacter endophyticus]
MFVNRRLQNSINLQLNKFPIVAVTGPRQSGKTTLLRKIFKNYRYVSLENIDMRTFASEDPNGFLKEYDENVILDEVQKVPPLFSYLQTKVDNSRKMGQYIISGSQNFHLLNNITQSLAGRVALFTLLPLDLEELKNANLLSDSYPKALFEGFYPAIFDREINPVVFYANYIKTYIEKDVTELLNIRDLKAFRTFLGLCAGRAGHLLNISALANDCDISQPTAKAWLSILESSYIIFLLQPYHENFNKRLVKSPKLYFYDSGLLSHLLGVRLESDIIESRYKGNLFENMILAEFLKQNYHKGQYEDCFFWQDSNANEIDILIKKHDKFELFEVKATETVSSKLFKQMDKFEELASPEKVEKTLIYGGLQNQNRSNYTVSSWRDISK